MRSTIAVRIVNTTTRTHEEEAEPPVQEHGERQEDDERDERGEVLAEEAEPEPGHAVRAFEHHLEHAAGMGRGVEGERQLEHVLEIVRHDGEAAAVREPVGMERHESRRRRW